jgi:hypothetical protein
MSRSIDEIEFDSLPLHTHWSELDRDTSLTLEIHLIECLRLHLTLLERTSDLHETISESRLAMIDMSYDTKIADRGRFGHMIEILDLRTENLDLRTEIFRTA